MPKKIEQRPVFTRQPSFFERIQTGFGNLIRRIFPSNESMQTQNSQTPSTINNSTSSPRSVIQSMSGERSSTLRDESQPLSSITGNPSSHVKDNNQPITDMSGNKSKFIKDDNQPITDILGNKSKHQAENSRSPIVKQGGHIKDQPNKNNAIPFKQQLFQKMFKPKEAATQINLSSEMTILFNCLNFFSKDLSHKLVSDPAFLSTIEPLLMRIIGNPDDNDTDFLTHIDWKGIFIALDIDTNVNLKDHNSNTKITEIKDFIIDLLTMMKIASNETRDDKNDFSLTLMGDVISKIINLKTKFPNITNKTRLMQIAITQASGKKPPITSKTKPSGKNIRAIQLSKLYADPEIEIHQGMNRIVFIDRKKGVGYKLLVPSRHLNKQYHDPSLDLRLNDILTDPDFYNGEYKDYKTSITEYALDDIFSTSPQIHQLVKFDLIPNAKPLSKDDQIPHDWLLQLEDKGFLFADIKPENFICVKKIDGTKDLIPIDSKFIGINDNRQTIRSQNAQRFKRRNLDSQNERAQTYPYDMRGGLFIDFEDDNADKFNLPKP